MAARISINSQGDSLVISAHQYGDFSDTRFAHARGYRNIIGAMDDASGGKVRRISERSSERHRMLGRINQIGQMGRHFEPIRCIATRIALSSECLVRNFK